MRRPTTILLFLLMSVQVWAQFQYPFQNPNLNREDRLNDLISRMTVQEKISQLMSDAPAIERLGIPKYDWWNESLHGVARAGYATVFPQSITIAGSWNTDLIYSVASVISDEARAKHHEYLRKGQHDIYQGLTMWSPNINIFRDPRWGRGHETYGEDPYLTGQLGLQFVKGLQGNDTTYLKVVATAKHFAVHSGPEPLRHEFDVNPSERDLWETYLPAFRTLVKDGQVQSVMTAYNRFRGQAASASDYLFDVLRNQWKFDGYVVSDCGAIKDIWAHHKLTSNEATASALALTEGCDLNCGSTFEFLNQALQENIITEKDIDIALKRVFRARFQLGMFDPEDLVPYAQIPFSVNNNNAHAALARKAAQESIILLKNEKEMLPLSKSIKSVAVIGPNANNIQSLLGNYSGEPSHPVTVFQGLKNKLHPEVQVTYQEGSTLAKGLPTMQVVPSVYFETEAGKQGLTAAYYNNTNWEGEPLLIRTDDNINFNWDVNTPDPRLKMGEYSVAWSGFIKVPKTGVYAFSDWAKPFMEYAIASEIEGGGKNKHHPRLRAKELYLEQGKRYKIEVKYSNLYGNAIANFCWSTPEENQLEKAVQLAKASDVTVLVLGLNERLEGEEMSVNVEGFSRGDRTSLDLPKAQQDLVKAIVATGKPVVLVLLNGSALSINWANEHIPAIISAGYPGQEGGNAIADVLFGDYNPAGRLPVTYYKSVDQLPDFEDYNMANRTYRYFKDEPLYAFGHGLSYTRFKYHNLVMPEKVSMNMPISVSVDVTNSGDYDGDEVVQLYLKDERATTPRPIVQLEGFQRIHLKKGETKTVAFTIQPEQLAIINRKGNLVIEPGAFTVYVGGQQPNMKDNKNLFNTVQVTGKVFQIEK